MVKRSLGVILFSCVFATGAGFAADSVGEPGRSTGEPNSLKNVYFGEQHMHTRNSFDAFTIGVTQTWEQAYRFGRGEEVTLSTTGDKMKRRTPYDFVAITDHSEYYGVLWQLTDPKSPLSKSDFAQQLAKMRTDPEAAAAAVQKLILTLVNSDPMKEYVTPNLRQGRWQDFIETANKFNDPGKFTALIAYEWTSIPDGFFGTPEEDFRDTLVRVDSKRIDAFISEWESRWNRPPTREEINGLIQSYIKEDVLYRQAVEMGLNEDDPITRRRMAQKLEFLSSDLAMMVQPAKGELEQYFNDNSKAYRAPDLMTFGQVFFDPDSRGDSTLEDAADALLELQVAGLPTEESMQGGGRFYVAE